MRKGNIVITLVPALLIPMLLVIFALIMGNFEKTSQDFYDVSVTGDTVNFTANNTYVTYTTSTVSDTTTFRLYNTSASGDCIGGTIVATGNYTLDESNGRVKIINANLNGTACGEWYIDYSHYAKSGFEETDGIIENTWNGYDMAGVLPIVVIAMIVVGLLMGGLALKM